MRSRPKFSSDQTFKTEIISDQTFQTEINPDLTFQTQDTSDQTFQTQKVSDQTLQTEGVLIRLYSENCPDSYSDHCPDLNQNKIRLKCVRRGYDQTKLLLKHLLSDLIVVAAIYDQTEAHSKPILIRLWRGPVFAISWTPFSDQSYWTLDDSLIRMLLYCCLLTQPTSLSKKTQNWKRNKALEMVPDQTNCVQKHIWSDPSALEEVMIRPNCARIRLWSDFTVQIDLWSVHLQTIVQTVRSKCRPDPVVSVWERTSARSTGSDHKPTWIWSSIREANKTHQRPCSKINSAFDKFPTTLPSRSLM